MSTSVSSVMRRSLPALALLFLCASCLLQDDPENFIDLSRDPNPEYKGVLYYSFLGAEAYPVPDTVWMLPQEYINLTFRSIMGGVADAKFRVNGGPWSVGSYNLITLAGDQLGLGPNLIEAVQYVKRGNGSLADNWSADTVSYSNSFVIVSGPIAFTPRIVSFTPKNGSVEIKWNRYDRRDFLSYEIRKYDYLSGTGYPRRTLTITDREQTSLIDTTYLGDRVLYVMAVNRSGTYLTSETFLVNVQYYPNMRLTSLGNGRARLSWDKSPLYNNIRSFKVYNSSGLVQADIPGDQTSIEVNYTGVFGQYAGFSLSMATKVDELRYDTDQYGISEDITYGKRTPPISDVEHDAGRDRYYVAFQSDYYSQYPEGFYELDKDLNITDTLQVSLDYPPNLVQSPDGNHLYMLTGNIIRKIEKSPLRLADTYQAAQGFNTSRSALNYVASNNGLVVYHQQNNLQVVNFISKQVVATFAAGSATHLSANGNYLATGSTLYTFNGTTFASPVTLPFSNILFLYIVDREHAVVIVTADKVIFYDFQAQTTLAEHTLSTLNGGTLRFDEYTMTYAALTAGTPYQQITSLNVVTGVRKSLPVYAGGYGYAGEYAFSKPGFGLKHTD